MALPEGSHPIWSIIRLIVLMGALTLVLWITATKFDQTEIKTIVYTFLAAGAGEGAITMIKGAIGKPKGE